MSHAAERDSTPDLSPIATNDDSPEAAGFLSNRNIDEVDEDDPFSKRRFDDLGHNSNFIFVGCTLLLITSFFYLAEKWILTSLL